MLPKVQRDRGWGWIGCIWLQYQRLQPLFKTFL